jgi:predicted ATP-grasp superfamily ATP-dependent carboligase
VPPARVVMSLSTGEAISEVEGLAPPMIVKPVRREPAWDTVSPGKALLVENSQDLRSALAAVGATHSSVIVQQLVPGPEARIESYHVYIDPAGEIAAEFTGRKLRTYPNSLGHSTALVTTSATDVARLGRSITQKLGLRGVAKLDFKRDPAGRLWLLEVNPRFTLWHRVGAAAGVNIPAIVAADLLNLPRPKTAAARPGVRWCKVRDDLRAVRQEGSSIAAWLQWLATCEAKCNPDPTDLMPLLISKIFAPAWSKFRQIGASKRRN